jgi:hypothetical protein
MLSTTAMGHCHDVVASQIAYIVPLASTHGREDSSSLLIFLFCHLFHQNDKLLLHHCRKIS